MCYHEEGTLLLYSAKTNFFKNLVLYYVDIQTCLCHIFMCTLERLAFEIIPALLDSKDALVRQNIIEKH